MCVLLVYVGSATAMGHSGPGEIQEFDSVLHPGLNSGCGRLRYHKYDTVCVCVCVCRVCMVCVCVCQAATIASVAMGVVYWGLLSGSIQFMHCVGYGVGYGVRCQQ